MTATIIDLEERRQRSEGRHTGLVVWHSKWEAAGSEPRLFAFDIRADQLGEENVIEHLLERCFIIGNDAGHTPVGVTRLDARPGPSMSTGDVLVVIDGYDGSSSRWTCEIVGWKEC